MFNKQLNGLTYTFGKWTEKNVSEVIHENRNHWQKFHTFFSSNSHFFCTLFDLPVWATREKIPRIHFNQHFFIPSSPRNPSFQAVTDSSWVLMLTLKSIIHNLQGMKKENRKQEFSTNFWQIKKREEKKICVKAWRSGSY